MSDTTDKDLVSRALTSQDTRAFGELVQRHQSRIRNFLRKLCGDMSLADDLAQDCFMHAWDKLHTFSGRGSFVGWLLRIAYTTFLQSRRKSKRYAEVLQEAGHVADLQAHTAHSEEFGDVEKLLAVLDDSERAIFVMSYACGMSHREISEAIQMPVGSVKSVIFRGKEKIRKEFDIEDRQHG